jgi:hypothetical protein
MVTDLAGATIHSATLTMYASGWGRSSGGTGVIGYHNSAARPAVWGTADYTIVTDVQHATFPKVGQVGVTLNATMLAALAAGTAKGFAMGPALSDSDLYDGHWDSEENSSHPPTLKVVYTK